MAVRALLFDVFGTLVDWRSAVAAAFRSSGVEGDPEQLSDAWTLSNGHVALLVDLGRHGALRFDCVLSAELAHVYKPAPEAYLHAADESVGDLHELAARLAD